MNRSRDNWHTHGEPNWPDGRKAGDRYGSCQCALRSLRTAFIGIVALVLGTVVLGQDSHARMPDDRNRDAQWRDRGDDGEVYMRSSPRARHRDPATRRKRIIIPHREAVDAPCMSIEASARLKAAYDRWIADPNTSRRYIANRNGDGVLANNEPEVAESLITMYSATGDITYLHEAATHALTILKLRDDFTGHPDYSGRARPVWSTTNPKYVNAGRPFGFLGESAWLSFPMAYFAWTVRTNPSVQAIPHASGQSLAELADRFLLEIEKTIDHHAPDWHTDHKHEHPIGYYTTSTDFSDAVGLRPGAIEPMNFQSSMGRLLAMLYLATGHQGYLRQAQHLAAFLLYDLRYIPKMDSYQWGYWPRTPYYPNRVRSHANADDLSHAGLSVDFMEMMARHRLGIFGPLEMRRLTNTFLRNLYRGRVGVFAARVDGGDGRAHVGHLGRFVSLNRWSRRVASILNETLLRSASDRYPSSTLVLLGTARLLAGSDGVSEVPRACS